MPVKLDISPPVFSNYSSTIYNEIELTMNSEIDGGKIYYTIDETDPRIKYTGEVGGLKFSNPIKINKSTTVISRTFYNNKWSPITKATFKLK